MQGMKALSVKKAERDYLHNWVVQYLSYKQKLLQVKHFKN